MSGKRLFPFTPNPTFNEDIEVPLAGETSPGVIGLTFRFMDADDTQSWLDEMQKAEGREEQAKGLMRVIADWSNTGVDFSEENLVTLLRNYPVFSALAITRYTQSRLQGRLKK